jgi:hypothetical protein
MYKQYDEREQLPGWLGQSKTINARACMPESRANESRLRRETSLTSSPMNAIPSTLSL